MTPIRCRFLPKAIKFTAVAFTGLLTISALQADTIIQNTGNPGSGTGNWNLASQWGVGAPMSGTDDYQSLADSSITINDAALNGSTWTALGQVRATTNSGAGADTTFAGNSLILSANTRLFSKMTGNTTATANIVFNGGYIAYSPDSVGNANLSGSISFGAASVGAIVAKSNGSASPFTVFNVHSTIIGDASKTLQLTMGGGGGNITRLTLDGDLSQFFGTIYLGVSSISSVNGGNNNSWFSINSNAINATVQMDTESGATATNGFRYNIQTDQTFGNLIINGVPYGPGSYNADYLNTALGITKFIGSGTITVVPEPSTTILSAIGLLGMIMMLRKRSSSRLEA